MTVDVQFWNIAARTRPKIIGEAEDETSNYKNETKTSETKQSLTQQSTQTDFHFETKTYFILCHKWECE